MFFMVAGYSVNPLGKPWALLGYCQLWLLHTIILQPMFDKLSADWVQTGNF